MKKLLVGILLVGTFSAFASDSVEGLDQFTGKYELINCEGKRDGSDPKNIEITKESSNSIKLRSVYEYVNNEYPPYNNDDFIENINGEKIKFKTKDEYACLNSTVTNTVDENILISSERFVSFPFCGKIPVFTGKKSITITNLGKGKLSVHNKHPFYEDRICQFIKL